MKEIILLIGLPGSGKSYYLKQLIDCKSIDDVSNQEFNFFHLHNLLNDINCKTIYLADVNFAKLSILLIAQEKIREKQPLVKFSYILFECSKEIALNNVAFRKDGRYVIPTIERFEQDIIITQAYIIENKFNYKIIKTKKMVCKHEQER